MEIKEITEKAKKELAELTGFGFPTVIGVNKEGNIWHIAVEIIEKPSTAINLDLLGIYDVQLDASGNLLGYERKKMRKRGDIQRESI